MVGTVRPMNFTSPVRRVAAVSAAALVASIVTAVPVSAATVAPLNYDCVTRQLTERFTVTADTDVPATVTAGAPVTDTATYTIMYPVTPSQTAPLRFVEGTAAITTTVFGAPLPLTATMPRVTVGTYGDFSLVAASGLSATAPATPGSYDIVAGDFSVVLDLTQEDGTPYMVPRVEFVCTLVAGQNAVVDTVEVVAAPPPPAPTKVDSTMKAKATYAKKADRAKVKVTVTGADGTAGSGKVKIVVKHGKKKVKATQKTQNESRAKATFRVK